MTVHARISPSGLKATKLCPGRVNANAGRTDTSTVYAAEGTLLHDIAADCLEQDFEPGDFIGQTRTVDGFEFVVDADMADCMVEGIDWIREQPGRKFVETKVLLDPWMPGQWGYLDLAILHVTPTKVRLSLLDWKFGVGMIVPIIGNYQLRAYALGFIETVLKPIGVIPDEIVLMIEQPRAFGKGPRYYDSWTITYDELLPFGDEMAAIMRAANEPDAPRIAGREQCFSCAAAHPGGCWQFDKYHFDLLGITLLPENEQLDPERRAAIIKNKTMIESWLKQITAQALDSAIDGNPPPGLKAIEGDQGDREWGENATNAQDLMVTGDWIDTETGEIHTIDALGEKSFNKKLISPAQVEKIAKPTRSKPGLPDLWEKLQPLIVRKPSKPQLVLESDPRPAIQSYDDVFEDLD